MDTDGYLCSLRAQHKAPGTIAGFDRELKRFEQFLRDQHLRVTQVTPRIILKYIASCDPEGKRRPATTRRRRTVLKSFFDYIELTTNRRMRNPVTIVRAPKCPTPNPKPVDENVLAKFEQGLKTLRDRAIFHVFLATGCRLAEVASMNRDTFQVLTITNGAVVQQMGVARVIGKNSKEREVLISLEALRVLHEYLQSRQDKCEAMFTSNRDTRMSARAIQDLFDRVSRRQNVPKIYPHRLRHTALSRLARLGVGTLEISKIAGWASVATAEHYLAHDVQRIRAEFFAAHQRMAEAERKATHN